jgi:hypothetical protein
MKTASTLLQILALGACFAMQVAAPGEFRMPGVRRAMQTMAGTASQPAFPELAYIVEGIGEY